MDYGKLVFTVGIVAMGLYGLYLGKYEIATGALGVMAGVLSPHPMTVGTVAPDATTTKKEDTQNEANTFPSAASTNP